MRGKDRKGGGEERGDYESKKSERMKKQTKGKQCVHVGEQERNQGKIKVSLWQRGGPSLLGLAPSWYAQVGGGPARESLMERVVMVRGGHSPVATCLRSPGTS